MHKCTTARLEVRGKREPLAAHQADNSCGAHFPLRKSHRFLHAADSHVHTQCTQDDGSWRTRRRSKSRNSSTCWQTTAEGCRGAQRTPPPPQEALVREQQTARGQHSRGPSGCSFQVAQVREQAAQSRRPHRRRQADTTTRARQDARTAGARASASLARRRRWLCAVPRHKAS